MPKNIMKAPTATHVIAILATERRVMSFGHELGVRVVGTYDSKIFSCLSSKFCDFMHPTADYLAKLKFRLLEAIAAQN